MTRAEMEMEARAAMLAGAGMPGAQDDPVGAAGLLLLAYALVRLLFKLVDRLPGGRGEAGFTARDRERLERLWELRSRGRADDREIPR